MGRLGDLLGGLGGGRHGGGGFDIGGSFDIGDILSGIQRPERMLGDLLDYRGRRGARGLSFLGLSLIPELTLIFDELDINVDLSGLLGRRRYFLTRQDRSGRHRPAGGSDWDPNLPDLSIPDQDVLPDDYHPERRIKRGERGRYELREGANQRHIPLEATGTAEENGLRLWQLMNQVAPGTTIELGQGEFRLPPERTTVNGEVDRPVRIVGSGEGTVLSGGSRNAVLHFDHSSNFSVENLQIRGAGALHGLRVTDSQNVHVYNNIVTPTRIAGSDDNSSIQFGGACSNVDIRGNSIFVVGGARSKTHCIYFGMADGGERFSRNITIDDNEMHYSGGGCGAMVQFNSKGGRLHENAVVTNNTFQSHGSAYGTGGGGIALAGIRDIRVENNTMNIGSGAFFEIWGQGVDGAIIQNNTFNDTGAPRSRPRIVHHGPAKNVRMSSDARAKLLA